MATFFSPNRVEELTVSLAIKLANGQGEQVRELTFSETNNGREPLNQLADLLLSACDLAASKLTPNAAHEPTATDKQVGGEK